MGSIGPLRFVCPLDLAILVVSSVETTAVSDDSAGNPPQLAQLQMIVRADSIFRNCVKMQKRCREMQTFCGDFMAIEIGANSDDKCPARPA